MTSDDPRQVAFDPAAPADERFDANAALGRMYAPRSASSLIPPENLSPIIDYINQGLEDSDLIKARDILVMRDARGGYGIPQKSRTKKQGMQSLYVDSLQVFASGEYFEKPTAIGFNALRTMCEQVPLLASVVMTRVRQVNRFCQISEDGGPGFEIRHTDRKHILTKDEQTVSELLAKFVAHCGWNFDARERKRLRRDTFPQFMAKSMRDSLSMDSCPIETEWLTDRSLGFSGFYAVDGATIRLCMEQGYKGDEEIFALQVVDGRIVSGYTYDQLIYETRNPRTDVQLNGYGFAEPEMMIRIVTGFLNALTHNIRGFEENSIPKGLLHLSGDYSQEDLSAFKRYWNSMVKGINNSWSLPVMVSKDSESKASFEQLGPEFDEMYFSKWMTFLASVVCAIYGMDPAEINFESFAANKSALSGNDTAEKLASAQDKGLRPFMSFYEGMLTDFIVKEFGDKWCFRWVSLEADDAERAWEAEKLILRVDEMRAERGYEPYGKDEGIDIGTAPVNPALIPIWSQLTVPVPGAEFGGPPVEEDGDFGKVPNEGASQPKGVGTPKEPSTPDFGSKRGESVAKAVIYRVGD